MIDTTCIDTKQYIILYKKKKIKRRTFSSRRLTTALSSIGKGFTVCREDNRGRERSTLEIMCLCCARPRQKRGKIRYG